MFGEELDRSDADGGVGGTGNTSSANVTRDSAGGPHDSGEDQKLPSPLGEDEGSDGVNDCYSDAPLSGTDWQGEEMSLRLHPSSPGNGNHGYKRSPTRGMLRAVSSITITDIEAFEEGFSTLRGNVTHVPLVDVQTITSTKKLSPVQTSTSTENSSAWSPSYRGSTSQKPRRGAGKSRRRREQRGESWYSDDEFPDEMGTGSPDRPPFAGTGEDTASMSSLIRRKSIDMLPNVPRRAPSTQDLADSGKATKRASGDEDSEMKRLMQTLHKELYLPGSKTPKLPKPSSLDKNATMSNTPSRGTSPLDMFTAFPPRRLAGGELAVDRFDRFNSDVDPFTNLLPRHQSLDGILYNAKRVPPRTVVDVVESVHVTTCKLTGDDESESEPESSHFKVREFVVSLDYLEDNKTRGDMPRRRRSFDALPTPPRRFLDELEAEDGDETSVRRRSFDDLGNARLRTRETEVLLEVNQDFGACLDKSHRSQQNNLRDVGSTTLDVSHRSQVGHPLDQSARSQPCFNPLDCSHRSQTTGSAELNEEDRSMRRTSHDILPAIPRRRLASECSSSSDSALSPLPLRMDDALVQKKATDLVPNAPRRTDSGIGSKASSLSISDFHLDEATISSSSAVKDPPASSSPKHSLNPNNHNNNLHNCAHLGLKSCDQIPSLPTRDQSLTAFDIFDIASEDQGNHADTEDNGGSHLETDYESVDGTTTIDRSVLVPIKDHHVSSSRYHGTNGMMDRTLVESFITEGGTSEELSPTTSDCKDSPRKNNNTKADDGDEEDHGDDEGGHDDHEEEDDTETTSLDHPEEKEAETSFPRHRANRRRKKKSSFLLRLFASRN